MELGGAFERALVVGLEKLVGVPFREEGEHRTFGGDSSFEEDLIVFPWRDDDCHGSFETCSVSFGAWFAGSCPGPMSAQEPPRRVVSRCDS